MLRSLFTGITGVRSHQVLLDVTGNNIANVNTTGFKTSQAQFVDTISQMIQGGAVPQPANDPPAGINKPSLLGGTNPAQVGLGVRLAGISTNFSQGSTQLTGRGTDVMLNGDGFFILNFAGSERYTRAGNFSFDANRELVAPNGAKVMAYLDEGVTWNADHSAMTTDDRIPSDGFAADKANGFGPVHLPRYIWAGTDGAGDPSYRVNDDKTTPPADVAPGFTINGPIAPAATQVPDGELQSFEIGPDGIVTAIYDNSQKVAVAQLAIAAFPNAEGLKKVGESLYVPTQNSGEPEADIPGEGQRGRLTAGTLEMSNVDLAQEFTNMILAQRGLQANSRTITTSDEVLQELVNLKR